MSMPLINCGIGMIQKLSKLIALKQWHLLACSIILYHKCQCVEIFLSVLCNTTLNIIIRASSLFLLFLIVG